MLGNEQDCVCAKNPKHTKYCDAYRLSEFIARSGYALQDEALIEFYGNTHIPTSPQSE